MRKNVLLKMSVFAVVPCFVIAIMLHINNINYFSHWHEFKAQINQIEQVKLRRGVGYQIDFETIPEAGSAQQILKFNKLYGNSSIERARFFNRVTKNSIIEIWINSEDNAVDITQPVAPDFLLKLYILLPTLGLFLFCFVAAHIFAERVVVKKRRRLKPTNGF
jgi:hypothetical protein